MKKLFTFLTVTLTICPHFAFPGSTTRTLRLASAAPLKTTLALPVSTVRRATVNTSGFSAIQSMPVGVSASLSGQLDSDALNRFKDGRGFDGAQQGKAIPVLAVTADAPPALTDAQIMIDIDIKGISNPDRERTAIAQFQKHGANGGDVINLKKGEVPPFNIYDRVIVQEAGQAGKHNAYVMKKGADTDRIIVVGGHMDRVEHGSHGIIDNWSGSTMVRHVYQQLRSIDTEATILFINYAREEEGLVGSRFFIKSLGDQKKKVVAVLNLDTEALNGHKSLENGTSDKMKDLMDKVAKEKNIRLDRTFIRGGDSDHTAWRRAGVTEVGMLFSGEESEIFDVIHTAKDNVSVFKLEDYKQELDLSIEVVKRMAAKAQAGGIAPQEWIPAGQPTDQLAPIVARIEHLIGTEDYKELGRVKWQLGALAADNPALRPAATQITQRLDAILAADAQSRGYKLIVVARRLAAAGQHAAAARQYEQAAQFYRAEVPGGGEHAAALMKRAAFERTQVK